MSYQPDPPAGAPSAAPFEVPGTVPPPPGAAPHYSYGYAPTSAVASPAPAATRTRRTGVLLSGIAVTALGLGAGIVLVVLGASAKEENVKAFARAPVGCTTTLEFDKRATFTIYIETKGTVGTVDGDCSAGGASYQRGDDDLPRVSLTLLNSDDQEAALTATNAPTYAVGGFAGQGYQRVQITEPGTYRLTVTSDDADFAIAVGGKPDAGAKAMNLAGVGAALIGLLLGGVLIILGLRTRTPVDRGTASNAQPALWQPAPPGAPGWQPQHAAPVPGAVLNSPTPPLTPTPPTSTPGPGWEAPHQ